MEILWLELHWSYTEWVCSLGYPFYVLLPPKSQKHIRELIHWLLFKNYFKSVFFFKLADCGCWLSKIVSLMPHSTLLGLCFLAVIQSLSKGSGLSWDGG